MENNMLNILWLAKSEYPIGSSLAEHSHDYYQIHYVISGEGDFIIGKECVTISRGMFLFIRPNDIHGISEARDVDGKTLNMLEVKYVVFDNELKERLNQVPNVCLGSENIEAFLELIFKEAIELSPWYLQIATNLLNATLYYIVRNQNIEMLNNEIKSKETDKIKDYINDNYTNEVSLDKIAQHLGHSKNYICKSFKENTGMTINLYLNKIRIEQATQLLVRTNLDITEVSNNVGYNNIYHFIKTFKKIVGTTPGNFRKNELNGNALVSSQVRAIATIPIPQVRNDV
ncbi:AraC family transcriptional regulator [Solibacillus sp. NPDC093137]|uniref:AraC family transcriptional regulator n=1 Tax=Solibacillus sp. NPDC093137 TaxID=3390678 RepID=UPI003CFC9F6D